MMNKKNYREIKAALEDATEGMKGYVAICDAIEGIVSKTGHLAKSIYLDAEEEERKGDLKKAHDLYKECWVISELGRNYVTDRTVAFALDRIMELKKKVLMKDITNERVRKIPNPDGRHRVSRFTYVREGNLTLFTNYEGLDYDGLPYIMLDSLKRAKDIDEKARIADEIEKENIRTMVRAKRDEEEGKIDDALWKYVNICVMKSLFDIDVIGYKADQKSQETGRLLWIEEMRGTFGNGIVIENGMIKTCCCEKMLSSVMKEQYFEKETLIDTPLGPIIRVDSRYRPDSPTDADGRSMIMDSDDGKTFLARRCPFCNGTITKTTDKEHAMFEWMMKEPGRYGN